MIENRITNFRDIGGCHVQSGQLKKGFFYRSGQLNEVTKEQELFLRKTCQIKKIFDFRSHKEVVEMPDRKIAGINYQNIDILATATTNGASFESMLNDLTQIDQSMMDTYEEIVMSSSAHEGYQDFMEQLVQQTEPIIFHCFAGKDRTGFGAALILKVAGADEQVIMQDYLLTNQQRKKANQKLLLQFKDRYTNEELGHLETALCVDARYLEHAWALITKNYGSFSKYLTDALALPKDYKKEFQSKFVDKK